MVKFTMQYATNMVVHCIITDGIFVTFCCKVCCKVYIVQGNKNLGFFVEFVFDQLIILYPLFYLISFIIFLVLN